jgi:hypothetical protein
MVSLLTAKGLSLLGLCAIANMALAADVYVCEKNGRKEFSQLPCGDNAVILQTEGDPTNLKISVPMKQKEVSALCKLVIKAKDRSVQPRKTYQSYNRSRSYNYDYNYDSGNTRANDPQAYVLSHIANLEQIAKQSPQLYEMIKGLTYNMYYHGYEESPIYEAERAAALTSCENNVSQRIEYMDRYN